MNGVLDYWINGVVPPTIHYFINPGLQTLFDFKVFIKKLKADS